MAPAVLWLGGAKTDRLEILPSSGPAKSAELKESSVALTDRTAVFAINAIREITIVEGKMVEQSYDRQTLLPAGKPASIAHAGAQSAVSVRRTLEACDDAGAGFRDFLIGPAPKRAG